MKKNKTSELADWLLTIPIDMDNYFLSPLANRETIYTDFTSLNGVKEIIMILLTRYEKLSMSQLADYIGSSNQRMTFPVNKLIEDDLVSRTKNPTDNRISIIEPTEKGKTLTENYLKATHGILSETMSDKFTDEDFERFLSILEKNYKFMKILADNIKTDYENNN